MDKKMNSELETKKQKIKEELDRLKHEFRVELPKRIAEARMYGDLKENAEYHAARERQSFVQARIAQLASQISQLNEMDISNLPEDVVGYGSRVTVLDRSTDDRIEFEFVSSNDINPSKGKITIASPVGVALQNRRVGEEVEVSIPAGKRKYYIEKLITIHGNKLEKKKN